MRELEILIYPYVQTSPPFYQFFLSSMRHSFGEKGEEMKLFFLPILSLKTTHKLNPRFTYHEPTSSYPSNYNSTQIQPQAHPTNPLTNQPTLQQPILV